MKARPSAFWLGRMPYPEAWALQRRLHAARVEGRVPDTLLLLEHLPIYTMGSAGRREHLRAEPGDLALRGTMLLSVDRGGDVTWHGPGQLVGYPILDVGSRHRDLHRLLREIEGALIEACAALGVEARRRPPWTGIWWGVEKLASIGMRVARWVSMHGFALNVDPDLSAFDLIVPCGIHGCTMTSLARALNRRVGIEEVLGPVVRAMGSMLGREPALEAEPTRARAWLEQAAGGEEIEAGREWVACASRS